MSTDWSSPLPLVALRALEFATTGGRCRWPACSERASELAHLTHRGRGGSASANVWPNVVGLCNGIDSQGHHDRLDGRLTIRWFDIARLFDAAGNTEPGECVACDRLAVTYKRIVGAPPDSPRFELCHYHAPMFARKANAYPGRRAVLAGLLGHHKTVTDGWSLDRLESELAGLGL